MLSKGPSKNQLKTIRQIAWALIAVLLVWFYVTHHAPPADDKDSITPITQVTQPFTLQTKTGKAFTEKDLRDKPSMMFFGFTHCPAICPGAMADMGIWLDKLGSKAKDVNAIFVSVDPERDTPARLTEFLKSYDSRIIGLTGTPEQIADITKTYGIYYKKMPAMQDGEYMVDHSATVFLYDKNRQLISTIDAMENRDIALAKIKKLVGITP
ncbi:MAG: SCO family protein [Alphaproteobacteria bacterium]|nr:SCO family protein [Alphaproteobacteria bacterium]